MSSTVAVVDTSCVAVNFLIYDYAVSRKYEKAGLIKIYREACKTVGDLVELVKRNLYTPEEIAGKMREGKVGTLFMGGDELAELSKPLPYDKVTSGKYTVIQFLWRPQPLSKIG